MKLNPLILNYDKPRRANMIKVCENCNKKYYPRLNGCEMISKFCGQDCFKQSRKKS